MNDSKTAWTANGNNEATSPAVNELAGGYLTTHQFAVEVGVRAETVRRWCRSGRLQAAGRTPTGQHRFHPRQVAEALGVASSQQEPPVGAGSVALTVAAQVRNDMLREMRQNRAG